MTISSDIEGNQSAVSRSGAPTQDETIKIGQDAWSRLRTERDHRKTLTDWIAVGHAHVIGRVEAMHNAHTNKPEGKAYCTEFSIWLKRHDFDDLDKGDRSRLFELMDNLPAIESWLAGFSPADQMRLNHPTTIVRKWRAAQRKDDPNKGPSPFVAQHG
jgi:hypothetical protein